MGDIIFHTIYLFIYLIPQIIIIQKIFLIVPEFKTILLKICCDITRMPIMITYLHDTYTTIMIICFQIVLQ